MNGTITVELDDNGVIISDDVTLCYGEGRQFIDALVDYSQTVLEWYQMVTDEHEEEVDEPTILERGNIMRRKGRYARS